MEPILSFALRKMIKKFHANQARLRRHQRIRRRLEGSTERPRLNVFRSGHHIYAQVIDDTTGRTLAAASSLEENLHDFQPPAPVAVAPTSETRQEEAPAVEAATEAAPAKGKGAKTEKAAKSGQAQKGGKGGSAVPAKMLLPQAEKGSTKTQLEALAAIASNRKVALAREVGKLVAQRAKEQGVSQVVFDRGGYAYHGRIASLAEGAREAGLKF
jgi:ribosomal protein L18